MPVKPPVDATVEHVLVWLARRVRNPGRTRRPQSNATDRQFVRFLPLIEQASVDDRNFVKKAVNWALRQIGKRNRALNRAAIAVAERLAVSPAAAARWVGKDALRELTAATVQARLARRDLMQVLPQIDTSRIKPHT